MKKRLVISFAIILTLLVGVFAVGVMALDNDPALTITGGNLEFAERVNMLFAVNTDNISDKENVKLLVFRGENVTVANCVNGKQVATLSMRGDVEGENVKGMLFKYIDVAAAEMTEDIYVRAYYTDGENEYYSNTVKYSILQYALNKLGVTGTKSENPELLKMLTNMLAYGSSAQEYFDVNLDRLAINDYVKVYLNGAVFEDGLNYGLFVKNSEISISSPYTDKPWVIIKDASGKIVAKGEGVANVPTKANATYEVEFFTDEPSFGAYDRVVIVGIDGAGSFYPDEVNENSKRIQEKIFGNGAVTRTMRVGTPTASCVGWGGLLHGVEPENLGFVENDVVENAETYPHDSKYPSILKLTKDAYPESDVAALYSWIGIQGTVEQNYGIDTLHCNNNVDLTNYITDTYLAGHDPKMLYVHLGNPDTVGHNIGHHTPEYYEALDTAYIQIEAIYDALDANNLLENTLFIVTTDHGGIEKGHGGLTDFEKYGMFAAAGKTVVDGEIGEMQLRDGASIALYALGIEQPETYTSAIPANFFRGVEATERHEYHDPDNPRYHLPEVTPEAGTDDYITNFVDNELIKYLPFDGNVTDVMGGTANTVGAIRYNDGYFGNGIVLDDGHVNIQDFQPGTESFTISMWIKTPSPHISSPIITNKEADTSGLGFMLVTERTGADYLKARFNFGNGTVSATKDIDLPEDYFSGWMHVLLVFDRENEEMRLVYDFGEVYSNAIHSAWGTMEGVDMSNIYDMLVLGNDVTGNSKYKCGLSVDEFMLFDGAFTREDMADLAAYYGKTVERDTSLSGVADKFDKEDAPEIYFDFDGNAEYQGNSPAFSLENSTVKNGAFSKFTYADGKLGQAIYLSNTEYITLSDLDLGTDDFSFAFWINPTDLSFGGGNRYKLPIFSTTYEMGRENQGMALMWDVEYNKLVLVMNDGGNNVLQNGELMLDPAAYENKWTHFAVTIDRANQRFIVYVNFEKALDVSLAKYGSSALFPKDASINSSYKFHIGQYGGVLSTQKINAYMDDLMIFRRTLNSGDIDVMYRYYNNISLDNYVGTKPVVDMGFNSNADNNGTYNGEVTDTGVNYGEGYYLDGATFTKGGAGLTDLSLDGKEYTISFWMNTDSFGFNFAYDNYWYRNIFATETGNNTESKGFAIVAKGDYGSRGGIFVNFSNGSGSTRSYVGAEYPADMEANEWVHVTVVINQNTSSVKIYYNFEEATLLTNYLLSNFPNVDLNGDESNAPHIGTDGTGEYEYTYTEKLDEFLLFDKALTSEEIAKLGEYYKALKG